MLQHPIEPTGEGHKKPDQNELQQPIIIAGLVVIVVVVVVIVVVVVVVFQVIMVVWSGLYIYRIKPMETEFTKSFKMVDTRLRQITQRNSDSQI